MDKLLDESAAISAAVAASNPEEIIKIDINKSTDEFVFQTLNPAPLVVENLLNQTSTTDQQDLLNSTALDSEEILSDYSAGFIQQQTTTTIQINGGPVIQHSTLIVATTPAAVAVEQTTPLSDVTHSLVNQPTAAAVAAVEPSTSNSDNTAGKSNINHKVLLNS